MTYLNKTVFRRKANYHIAWLSEWLGTPFRRWQPMPVPADERARWKRGLLFGADHIGDILYGTSSLPALARATPGCAWQHAVRPPANQVLENNPHLQGLLPLPPEDSPARWRETVRVIRAARFDVAICYDSSSYVHNLAAVAAAGVPVRIAYIHKGFSVLATHPVTIRYPQPFAYYFRDLISQVTGETLPGEPRPVVYPTDNDRREADSLFAALGLDRSGPVLACSLFSRGRYARYEPLHFIETLRLVVKKVPARLVFICSRAERDMMQTLLAESGLPHAIVAGDLNLRSLACFLGQCRAAFAVDSGIRHLANAVGIPVVFARSLFYVKEEAGRYCSTETDIAPPDVSELPEHENRPEIIAFDHARAAAAVINALSGSHSPIPTAATP
jgi:ADP-heptose:LPS heptosyltransferase